MEWTEDDRRDVRRRVRYDNAYTLSLEEVVATLVRQVEVQIHHGLDPKTAANVTETLEEIRDLVIEVVVRERARVQAEFAEREAAAQAKADDQAVAAANGERVA